jgi:putative ABC transport system permease protein
MLKHNLLIIFRNFKRDKSTFFINLIGLSTGLACALLIYLWINDELHVDKFNKNDSRLYQVMLQTSTPNGAEVNPEMPPVLAKALNDEVPEVEDAVNEGIVPISNMLSSNHKYLKASGVFAGKDYFNVFSYPLIEGRPNQVLSNESSIVISKSLAVKFFGTTLDIIGKPIEFEDSVQFLVSGIFDIPASSSKSFDFILPFETQFSLYPNFKDSWNNSWPNVYVLVKQNTDISQLNLKINNVVKSRTDQFKNASFFLRKFSSAYLYGKYENGVQTGGRIEYVRLFSIIGILILLIACINFMNLSTARSSKRMREVGIKKTFGVKRRSLILQYLSESIVVSLISLLFATVIVELILPYFNQITGKQITFSLNAYVIIPALAIAFLTGLVAGSYPAFYISRFNPISVLKGNLNSTLSDSWLRKGLVIFQFTLSVMLIVAVIIVYKQMEFIQNKNLGYNRNNIVYFEMEGSINDHQETFLSELRNVSGVVDASSIWTNFYGLINSTSDIYWEGKNPSENISMQYRRVNYGMLELLGIKMEEGRSFDKTYSASIHPIIFNETAIKLMGLKSPVGKVIKLWENDYKIIGVTKDFNFQSLHESIKPLFFILDPERTNTIMARISSTNIFTTVSRIKNLYSSFTGGLPFDYKFLNDLFQKQYTSEKRIASLSKYFAGLAIIISCLGLFGLTIYTAQRRTKEIGMRKVLGASELGIVYLLSTDFTKLVLASIMIALPISYILMKNWLDSFVDRIQLNLLYFITAGFTTLLIAWITISVQAFKAARINPADCLRNE